MLSVGGELLEIRAHSRVAAVAASGAAWFHAYAGELCHLHALPRRLDEDLVDVGVWNDMLEVG